MDEIKQARAKDAQQFDAYFAGALAGLLASRSVWGRGTAVGGSLGIDQTYDNMIDYAIVQAGKIVCRAVDIVNLK